MRCGPGPDDLTVALNLCVGGVAEFAGYAKRCVALVSGRPRSLFHHFGQFDQVVAVDVQRPVVQSSNDLGLVHVGVLAEQADPQDATVNRVAVDDDLAIRVGRLGAWFWFSLP